LDGLLKWKKERVMLLDSNSHQENAYAHGL